MTFQGTASAGQAEDPWAQPLASLGRAENVPCLKLWRGSVSQCKQHEARWTSGLRQ